MAAQCDLDYPQHAPHTAMMLGDVTALCAEVETLRNVVELLERKFRPHMDAPLQVEYDQWPAGVAVNRGVRPRAWMVMRYGVSAQATTDEPTAIRWRKADGDVRPLYEVQPLSEDARMEPQLMTALRLAWEGNHKGAEAYALLAADKLEARGEVDQARYLRMAVDEMTGRRQATVVYAA